MDEQERAVWQTLIRRKTREEDAPSQEFFALIHERMLGGLPKDVAQEKARYIVRYWVAGEDLSDILPRGVQLAHDWLLVGAIRGPEAQEQMTRDLIDASDRSPVARQALNEIAIAIQESLGPWPADLAAWDVEVRRGRRRKPPQRRGSRGQPAYVKARRNQHIHTSVHLLWWLGMGKMDSYHVVADEFDVSPTTVRKMARVLRFSRDNS